jgi:hypothetical protein
MYKCLDYNIFLEPISYRNCKFRVKGKFYNLTQINVYAPTEDKKEDVKEKF